MEYIVPLVIVLLLVGGFVTFMVMNATRRGQSATRSGEDGPPGIGRDRSPLGDTTEHAGRQDDDGRTVAGQDAAAGKPLGTGYEGTGAAGMGRGGDGAHVRRSGEAEGTERLDFADVEPPAAAREQAASGAVAAGAGDGDAAPDDQGASRGDDGSSPPGEERDATVAEERGAGEREPDPDAPPPASERLADRGF